MDKNIKVLVITGPTATGKTALAVELARQFEGEVISVDSRQVFRGMDLGTGKDIQDYITGGKPVPYHLIDVEEPEGDFHLLRFCNDAAEAVTDIASRGRLPMFCGGTAMYLDAILKGYELPGGGFETARRTLLKSKTLEELQDMLRSRSPERWEALKDKENPVRLIRALEMLDSPLAQVKAIAGMIKPLVIAPYYHRSEVHRRIEQRLDQRLDAGMIEEVEALHREKGVSYARLEFFGLEYRFIALYLQGVLDRDEMRDQLLFSIRKFAKRQDIWFRKMEREGLDIYWLDEAGRAQAPALVRRFLNDEPLPEPELRIMDIHYGPKTS
jgi:tRNA dimethylallyltransferase